LGAQAQMKLNTIVLPKPIDIYQQEYYKLLEEGNFELDATTPDNNRLNDISISIYDGCDVPTVGKDSIADNWAQRIYYQILDNKKCLTEQEFNDIRIKRLPDFFAINGGAQKLKDYIQNLIVSDFVYYLNGMPVFSLCDTCYSIPFYNKWNSGNYKENSIDYFNFDQSVLLKCQQKFNDKIRTILSKKFLKPGEAKELIIELEKIIKNINVDESLSDSYLVLGFESARESMFLSDGIKVNVLNDFKDWLFYWSSRGYPIGLQLYLQSK